MSLVRWLSAVFTEIPNEAAISILSELEPTTAIVFCNTIANVKQFSRELYESGFICLALHGDLEQKRSEFWTARVDKTVERMSDHIKEHEEKQDRLFCSVASRAGILYLNTQQGGGTQNPFP